MEPTEYYYCFVQKSSSPPRSIFLRAAAFDAAHSLIQSLPLLLLLFFLWDTKGSQQIRELLGVRSQRTQPPTEKRKQKQNHCYGDMGHPYDADAHGRHAGQRPTKRWPADIGGLRPMWWDDQRLILHLLASTDATLRCTDDSRTDESDCVCRKERALGEFQGFARRRVGQTGNVIKSLQTRLIGMANRSTDDGYIGTGHKRHARVCTLYIHNSWRWSQQWRSER